MRLDTLQLSHFRNYADQHLVFGDGVNVFLGQNAQGKTNVVEAVYTLAVGRSHRTHRDSDLIQWGEDVALVKGTGVCKQDTAFDLAIEFRQGNKRAAVNGILQPRMTDFIGHFQVVLFAPEDLQLVKGNPVLRRRFLDRELSQTQVSYLHHLSAYTRALQQRNRWLRRGMSADQLLLDTFDEQLAIHGAQVWRRRYDFVKNLRQHAQEIHEEVSNGREVLDIRYKCSVRSVQDASRVAETPNTLLLEDLLREALLNRRAADMHLGATSTGPHRDDLLFLVDEQDAQAYGSQGQQRTVALSMRLAEIEFIRKEVGEYPVLLLDDVLSELDDSRQRRLVLAMSEKVQTVLTTTSLFQLAEHLTDRSRLFHVQSGIINGEG